jgi:hypothetical protein
VNLTTNGVVTDPFEIWVDDPDPGDIVECSLANMSDCFMECYVRVVRDLTQHEGDGVPFLRNFPDVQDLYLAGEADRGCLESNNYWSVYLQFVFEYSLSRDHDPDGESAAGGANTPDEPEYAFVFVETCKDVGACYLQPSSTMQTLVATHEIGHQFECAQTVDGSIMDKNLINLVPGTRRFSDVSKNTIRSAGCP